MSEENGNLEECGGKKCMLASFQWSVLKYGRCVIWEFPCGPKVKFELISFLCAHFLFIRMFKNFTPSEE